MRPSQFQKVHRAVDVGLDVKLRISQRRPHARARGEVDNTIEAVSGEGLRQSIVVANVSFDQFEVRI